MTARVGTLPSSQGKIRETFRTLRGHRLHAAPWAWLQKTVPEEQIKFWIGCPPLYTPLLPEPTATSFKARCYFIFPLRHLQPSPLSHRGEGGRAQGLGTGRHSHVYGLCWDCTDGGPASPRACPQCRADTWAQLVPEDGRQAAVSHGESARGWSRGSTCLPPSVLLPGPAARATNSLAFTEPASDICKSPPLLVHSYCRSHSALCCHPTFTAALGFPAPGGSQARRAHLAEREVAALSVLHLSPLMHLSSGPLGPTNYICLSETRQTGT